jgi:hypothetical protein
MLASDKRSGLLGAFVSYEGNEVLQIQPLSLYSQHFILFITYEWAKDSYIKLGWKKC